MSDDQTYLLGEWRDFLDAQMELFDHEMEKQNGRPFRADDVNVAFLEVDNQIYKREIDDAVMHFVQNGAWPKLSVAQLRLLSLRAFMARGVLLAMLDGTYPGGPAPLPDDLTNKAQVIQRLLVQNWNLAGAVGIKALAADFLRNSPAHYSRFRKNGGGDRQ